MTPKVVTENGLTIDLSQVKCFKREDSFNDRCCKIIIEFKTRYEYIKHPGTGRFIKQKINDTVEYECCDYETTCQYQIELKEAWQKYLDEQ